MSKFLDRAAFLFFVSQLSLTEKATFAKARIESHDEEQRSKMQRYFNPWTIQVLNKITNTWMGFCEDSPITLGDAENRLKELKDDPSTAAGEFRVIPWLNGNQFNHIREETSRLNAEIEKYKDGYKKEKQHYENATRSFNESDANVKRLSNAILHAHHDLSCGFHSCLDCGCWISKTLNMKLTYENHYGI